VIEALGGPVKVRHGKTELRTTLAEGTVTEGALPLEGKMGLATLYYRARRTDMKWNFEVLRVTLQPSHREFNLLTEPDDISLQPALAQPPAPPPSPPSPAPVRPVRRRPQK
jgi:hypothetical protein